MSSEESGPKVWQVIVFIALIVAILACTALPVILQFHFPEMFGFPPAKKIMTTTMAPPTSQMPGMTTGA